MSGVNPIIPPKVEDVAAVKGKKKAKREQVEQNVVNSSMVEEESRRDVTHVSALLQMGWSYEEYMPWLGDEQMSWGSTWFPWWDMDFMGEAFNALYSDVVWDDDIWNLNNEIPIPLDTKM